MSKGAGGEGRRGSGTRCGGSVEGFGGGRWGLVLMGLRCAVLGVAYWFMYQWRMGLNGSCVTVYKTKGDPMISAWDSAGTVAPGVYSEAACRPNFLQVENPARFVKGPKILTDKITHTNTNTHTNTLRQKFGSDQDPKAN